MTINVGTLSWTDSADPDAPVSIVVLDFAQSGDWHFMLNGTYQNHEVVPVGVIVDNSQNNAIVMMSYGSVTTNIPQFQRSTIRLAPGTQQVSFSCATPATVPVQWFVKSGTPDITGQFEALVAAAQAALAPAYGDVKPNFLGIEQGGWRLAWGQQRPMTDPLWQYLIQQGLTTVWPFGSNIGAQTYTMPDLRDVIIAGLGTMGGTPRGLLTQPVSGMESNIIGFTGGDEHLQIHNHTSPGHNHGQDAHSHGQDPHGHTQDPHSHTVDNVGSTGGPDAGGGVTAVSHINVPTTTVTATNQPATATNQATTATNQPAAVSIDNNGAGITQNVQPTIICPMMMYVGA